MARETSPVPPSDEIREIKSQVVGELHRVDTTQHERRGPVPPSCEKSPKDRRSQRAPSGRSRLRGHSGGEFGGDKRDGDTPEERDYQQENQGHARARGGDHVFKPKGTAGTVGKHYPDEIEEAGFAQGGLRGGGHGRGLYGKGEGGNQNADFRFQIEHLLLEDS